MKLKNKNKITLLVALFFVSLFFIRCKKFLDTPLPSNVLAAESVYISDASTSSVLSGILNSINEATYTSLGGNVGLKTGLWVDELQNVKPTETANEFYYKYSVEGLNTPAHWAALYKNIYACNLALEGIRGSTSTLVNRNQWLGEALFCRAYLYFHLVNLYGDVALALTSDHRINNKLSRSPKAQVYQQIIADLKEAQGMLNANYVDASSVTSLVRIRPNKACASALLARVYLYTGDWANAETEATTIISNTSTYQLLAPSAVFLANSKETIWAIASPTGPAPGYNIFNKGMPAVVANPAALSSGTPLTQAMVNIFEIGDVRFTNWVRTTSTTTPAQTYYYPNKYKSAVIGAENYIALRVSEQYLIRAEARAKRNNVSGAVQDLNAVRARSRPTPALAILPDYLTTIDQTTCLAAIDQERRVELFAEFGSRFFDLKRTGTIDAIMVGVAAAKGAVWNTKYQLWPIPAEDMRLNPNLVPTPGY